MKYLKEEHMRDADSGEDLQESAYLLEARLAELRRHRAEVQDRNSGAYADLLLEESRLLIRLEKMDEAWDAARAAFDIHLNQENWQGAVEACDVLYAADRPGSLAALGQGIWLAVTFPIDPELTVAMLEHVVEETPDDSDGAAVAAVTAHYVADLRTEGKRRDDLVFYTNNLLGTVARRHSQVQSQEAYDYWVQKLELHDPQLFLPRLRNVVDVLVQDEWWFDRDALRERLPVN
ncbi:MAG TPA: hypothetical protein VJ396_06555 [Acidiferrobacterales bacterium]|nr:hypothetical protein [Acidiferrobacterales bacterium]